MKFKFKIQDYQTEAVNAVVKVFEGQAFNDHVSYLRDLGNQTENVQQTLDNIDEDYGSGFGNAPINLTDGTLLSNIRTLQLDNNIKQSATLSKPFGVGCRCALDIEMETGTGKTYCYIKTIFELNKKYGWSKFIVVVPSIAIREGVKKSFEVMEDHFFEQYGKKARYFIYNSKNLNQLDNFSASKDIYVMIINAQAFASSLKEGAKNEAARIIYSKQDSFGSRRPIDVIAANRPIVILDEPQKLGGDATQASIKLFKPLFSLNYSATHRETHNLVYVLDALDAYQKKLVKKIEVKGFELRNLRGTDGFVYLSQILLDPKKPPRARITFEVNYSKGINREQRIVEVNDNLYKMSAGKNMPPLEQYKNGFIVKEIDPINNSVTFLNGITLAVGEVQGDISERDMRRIQIRETILSHFEKEEKLFNMGVKCLSLFFIDEVAHYRQYDENGNEILGDFGVMFEQEYNDVLKDYADYADTPYIKYLKSIAVQDTHKGYFSIDKKTNRIVNSVEKKGVCDDISAYDLILKNKERLLSFDEPTRFIFSHSALREGWDNPNVFQICTLKQSNSEINKRQEVGRGMRLCVNREGDRIDGSIYGVKVHDINVLTVIASDSYKSFVGELQAEIKSTLYDRPTKATIEFFTGKVIKTANGTYELTEDDATDIFVYLRANGYVSRNGSVTDVYRAAQEQGNFAALPSELEPMGESIHKLIQGIFDEKIMEEIIAPANKPKITQNELNENFAKKEFQRLWKLINHKYAYSVSFDSDELIEKAIDAINDGMYVAELTYVRTIGAQGESLDFTEGKTKTTTLKSGGVSGVTYDLVGKICKGTALTRKTVVKILQGIKREAFEMFKRNPEDFILKAIRIINEQKATMIVDEITYNVTEEEPYSSDIFTAGKGVIDFNSAVKADNHITPYVVVDSDTEKRFAVDLDSNKDDVCVYAKLPRSFKIPTPVGDYSPDWAIAFNEGAVKYVYFIAETKGSMESLQLRKIETAKISCARKLFEKIGSGAVRYDVADTYQHLMDIMSK
ncbi:MAG: DEAD/DEAH box helicase family protein [Clostridia bacterium]|nr:DEAD/DEAH box helicase family protein [Clostridia bacterium]